MASSTISIFSVNSKKQKAENDARIDKQRKKHEKILLTVNEFVQ